MQTCSAICRAVSRWARRSEGAAKWSNAWVLLPEVVAEAIESVLLLSLGLAVIFGIIGYNQVSKGGEGGSGKGMAIAGIVCGSIGCLLGLWILTR